MEQQTEQLTFDFFTEQPSISNVSPDEIKLELGAFAGPLDLLLYLIRQEKANIFDIPIARIADEYLKYIRLMKSLDISLAGDFLVMAATLIEIKSKMLLPREIFAEDADETQDPRRELVDRLLEYEKFKSAAQMLYEKTTVEAAVFSRGKIEADENASEINVSTFDLLHVFQKIMARRTEEFQMAIEREEMSLAEMITALKQRIFSGGEFNVLDFFASVKTKSEMVLAFIAILEIVRTESVKLLQDRTFSKIVITKI